MFTCGGFYSVSVSSKLTIVVLNTVLYSVRHNPKMSDVGQVEDPMGQFAWLDNTLDKLQQDKVFVWIVGHIAPGYDSFAMEPMWPNTYTRKYISIITKYARIVKAQFFGHEHLNTYRLFESGSNVASPILISGSISPIFVTLLLIGLLSTIRIHSIFLILLVMGLTLEMTIGLYDIVSRTSSVLTMD